MTDAAQASPWQGKCERGGLGAPFAFNQRHLRSKCTGRTLADGRPPRLWRRLSSPILSSLEKKESGPRRALDKLSGRPWLVEIFKFVFKAWWNRVLRWKLAFAVHQSLYAVWVRLNQSRCTALALFSWSLIHTQGEPFLYPGGLGCLRLLLQNPSDAAKAAPAPLSGEPSLSKNTASS